MPSSEVTTATASSDEVRRSRSELPIDLPVHARAELLQIAREALSNMARHSQATWAELGISLAGDEIVLAIADNGRGFDPTTAGKGEHYGLANMRDRAVALGGTLDLQTAIGAGTRIIVRIPATGYAVARDLPDPSGPEKR